MLNFKLIQRLITTFCFICLASQAQAAIQQHNFTVTGAGGTGSGSFTWDDAVYPDGSSFPGLNLLSFSLTLSGAAVISGPTTFTLADCSSYYFQNTPDFLIDMNMDCDNGTNTIAAIDFPYGAGLNSGTSNILFVPGATTVLPSAPPQAAPTLSEWMLILLTLMLGGIGYTAAMKTKES